MATPIEQKQTMHLKEILIRAKMEGHELSEYTLKQALKNGEIPYQRPGRNYIIAWANVKRWLEGEKFSPAAPIQPASASAPKKIRSLQP